MELSSYQVLRIAGALILLWLFPIIARKRPTWRYLVYGPLLYCGLILVFYFTLYRQVLTPVELNEFNGWLGVLDLVNWIVLVIYKLRLTHYESI